MKIKELYIHNYKSFYDSTIKLNKTNIVVGENNSGKSNLIDFLEFLNIAISKDFVRAIEDKGGFSSIRNYKYNDKNIVGRIKFEFDDLEDTNYTISTIEPQLKLLIGKGEYIYSYKFTEEYCYLSIKVNAFFSDITYDIDIFENVLNKVDYDKSKLEFEKIEFSLINKVYFNSNQKSKVKLFIKNKVDKNFLQEHRFAIFDKLGLYVDEEYRILKFKDINLLSSYYFDAKVIKEQSHKESLVKLKKDGSNLGTYLYHGLAPEAREEVSNSLIGIVNEISGIEVADFKNNYIITFKERDKEVNIEQVSDGTVNLLAAIAVLSDYHNSSKLLVFEEPERHLHLKAISFMLELFRENRRQILVTSHSSEILKYANLDEIIFMYRDSDGDTQAVRAVDVDGLKDKLKNLAYERELTVDELIADGIVGDFE